MLIFYTEYFESYSTKPLFTNTLQKISSMTDVKPNDFQLNYLVTTF